MPSGKNFWKGLHSQSQNFQTGRAKNCICLGTKETFPKLADSTSVKSCPKSFLIKPGRRATCLPVGMAFFIFEILLIQFKSLQILGNTTITLLPCRVISFIFLYKSRGLIYSQTPMAITKSDVGRLTARTESSMISTCLKSVNLTRQILSMVLEISTA